MQPDQHAEKYASFLEGLSAYMDRLRAPKKRKAANDNAKGMAPLLPYRNGPPSAGVQTNWSLTPNGTFVFDPENDAEESSYSTESRHEIRPSENLTMAGLEGVEFREFRHAKAGGGGSVELIPIPGKRVGYGVHIETREVDGEKVETKHKVVTRLGCWRFSDGEQTEQAHKRRDKKVVKTRLKMPVGAMLGMRYEANQPRGGEGSRAGSKPYFEAMLGAKHRYVKGGLCKKGKSYSRAESATILAEAYSNTPVLPPVTMCEPGIASGGNYRPRDLFIGLQKTTCAGGGAINWQDAIETEENRKVWFTWVASLKDEDKAVLDIAKTARSYEDVGQSLGFSGDYARKAGKRAVLAANDNAREAMKKIA
ncbi:hypothetical protein [Mesorhizobium sp. 8]|uniref:hypothetical protein n=1 Tax=Mesorhizobium sp. 8 TaxID=2584466 RepID=UPI00111E634F|nr:hypothetical protein [Mesorhizobium sp. 8]QDC00351.1 hypothetical protein FGU64_07945 [Mesorhizobium sp. 8]